MPYCRPYLNLRYFPYLARKNYGLCRNSHENPNAYKMDISTLLNSIRDTHQWFAGQAARQINTSLTLRNWLIGMYLFEYEQKGQDRAQYGEALYQIIADKTKKLGLKGMGMRSLYHFRSLYLTYPQILQFLTAKLQLIDNQLLSQLSQHAAEQAKIVQSETGKSSEIAPNDIHQLLNRLTYTHFVELMRCDTDLKRMFYETQAMLNNWNVKELGRAIDSMLFERTGLSTDKAATCPSESSFVRKRTIHLCITPRATYPSPSL